MNASALPAQASACEYTGTLIAPAECRMRPTDADGHMAPVLVLLLELDNPLRTHLRAEQPFAPDAQDACRHAARRYRVGTRLSVQATLESVRLIAGNTQHVHVLHPQTEEDHSPS